MHKKIKSEKCFLKGIKNKIENILKGKACRARPTATPNPWF